MSISEEVNDALSLFERHYTESLSGVRPRQGMCDDGRTHECCLTSDCLREGNYPKILHHGKRMPHVIVLTHGLSDSPYYLEAIGRRFLDEGVNVVLPLLPAHGLKDPDKAMEDKHLNVKWKATVDHAVAVAENLGACISLGGFSTGGALSLNRILRRPDGINGGLFLFSAAIDLGLIDAAGGIGLFQTLVGVVDGHIAGIGPNPYKYPQLPKFAGMELAQIIKENDRLWRGNTIAQPVFAAHSMHDETVKLEGVLRFLEHHVERGFAFLISEQVSHSSLVLENDIKLDDLPGTTEMAPPKANPRFDWMMDNTLRFFREQVVAD